MNKPQDDASHGSAPRVLVVDDDHFIRTLAERILPCMGVRVATVDSAEAALSCIPSYRPHAILLDFHMPTCNVHDLIRLIRAQPTAAGTVVVLHSAMASGTLAKHANECGADAYISKCDGLSGLQRGVDALISRQWPTGAIGHAADAK